MNTTTILKTIVGSVAHHLNGPNSDIDYREVYVVPTVELLKVNPPHPKNTQQHHLMDVDGKGMDLSRYELSHFLHMSIRSNPTVLETYRAPIVEATPEGIELQRLFPYVWSSQYVHDAYLGYASSQKKDFERERFGKRADHFITTYLRILYNVCEILST